MGGIDYGIRWSLLNRVGAWFRRIPGCVGCVGQISTWVPWVKYIFAWVFAWVKLFYLGPKFLRGSIFFALVNFYLLDEIFFTILQLTA